MELLQGSENHSVVIRIDQLARVTSHAGGLNNSLHNSAKTSQLLTAPFWVLSFFVNDIGIR